MMNMPTAIESLIAAAIVFVGATVLSTIGFGIGMTTSPALLFLFDAQTVVVVINTVSLFLFVSIIYHNRAELPARRVWPWAAAGLAGVPIGVMALRDAESALIEIAITSLTIALTLLVASNVRAPIPRGALSGVIVALGVSVTLNALGIGGPIMALYALAQGWTRNATRGALSLYFLFVETAGVIGYAVSGLMTQERIALILVMAAPALMGFWLATRLTRRMSDTVFRRVTIGAVLAMCAMSLARTLPAAL